MALQQPPLRRMRLKGIGDYAKGHAGVAIVAAWTIGDVLAAAKADAAERLVELSRARTPQFGEYLTLCLARQIGARGWRRHEKSGKAERLIAQGPVRSCTWSSTDIMHSLTFIEASGDRKSTRLNSSH